MSKFLESNASTAELEKKAEELIVGNGSLGSISSHLPNGTSFVTPSEFYTYLDYLVDRERVDVAIRLIFILTSERKLLYRDDNTEDLKKFLRKKQGESLLLKALLRYIRNREDALPTTNSAQFTFKEFITGQGTRVNDTTFTFPFAIEHYLRNEPLTDIEPTFFRDLSQALRLAIEKDEDRTQKHKEIFSAILPELTLIIINGRTSSKLWDEALAYLTGFRRVESFHYIFFRSYDALDEAVHREFVADFLTKLTPAQLLALPDATLYTIFKALNDEGDQTYNADSKAAEQFRSILRLNSTFQIAHGAYQIDAQIRIKTSAPLRTYLKLDDPTYFKIQQLLEGDSDD